MPFPASSYNYNNFDSTKNPNGSFVNLGLGANSPDNFLWSNHSTSNYYDNEMLGTTTPSLAQSLSNISSSNLSTSSQLSQISSNAQSPSMFSSMWNSFLSLFSSNEQEIKQEVKQEVTPKNDSLVNVADSQLGNSFKKYTNTEEKIPWCAAFVTWCLRENGTAVKGDNGGWNENWNCVSMAKNLLEDHPENLAFDKQEGKTDVSKIKPGAIIFFSDSENHKYTHVGIVKEVKDGRIYTTEGNTTDKNTGVNQVSNRDYAIDNGRVQTIINV